MAATGGYIYYNISEIGKWPKAIVNRLNKCATVWPAKQCHWRKYFSFPHYMYLVLCGRFISKAVNIEG